jgi:hypothetical protein
MTENRRVRRQPVIKSGTIILGKAARLPCRIWDLSSSGARLEVLGTFSIPLVFRFAMAGFPQRICKVVWRTDGQIGVEFVGVAEQ